MPFKALIEELIFSPILLILCVFMMFFFYLKPRQQLLRAYHIGLYTHIHTYHNKLAFAIFGINTTSPLDTTNHKKSADAIVVLGSLLTRSGGPSSVMGERIITGTQLFIEKKPR